MHKKNGFTLVEIIVATIILSLVIAGMLGVFVAGNNWAIHFRERTASAELGKYFIDPFQNSVLATTWSVAGNNALNDGSSSWTLTLNNRPYKANCIINDVAGTADLTGNSLRRVNMNITWTEPSP